MSFLISIYHTLQTHPLYWQTPVGLITTSGVFEYVKRKLALEGKAKITAYLSGVSTIVVLVHAAIVGLTFAGPLGLLKGIGTQATFFLGLLTVTYSFLTTKVVAFLQAAKADAKTSPATPPQKNQTATSTPAAEGGVVTI
jgi:hypothetical protein